MEGYGISRRDRQGRQGGGITLYLRKSFDNSALTVSGDDVEIPWVKFRKMENKGDVVVGVLLISQTGGKH